MSEAILHKLIDIWEGHAACLVDHTRPELGLEVGCSIWTDMAELLEEQQ